MFDEEEFNRERELWIVIQRCLRKNPQRRPRIKQIQQSIMDLLCKPFVEGEQEEGEGPASNYVDITGKCLADPTETSTDRRLTQGEQLENFGRKHFGSNDTSPPG